jgi:sulfate permease, SulP family
MAMGEAVIFGWSHPTSLECAPIAHSASIPSGPVRSVALTEIGHCVNRLRRFVPIASWLPAYQRNWLPRDIVAGVTIWGLLIPEMIAYASLAGLPPQVGPYTLLASLAIYAIFGTSRQLVVAGTSASAILVYSTVTSLAPKTGTSYMTLAAGMIVLTGILLVVSGLLRLGFITSFLSRPVMEGFVFGIAVFVTVSQLPKLFGLTKGNGDTIRQLAHVIAHLGDASWTTFAVGALSLGALFILERLARGCRADLSSWWSGSP